MPAYSPEIEQAMQKYYATLSEKDQRRYAAIEALQLPPAEHSYIAQVLGCSRKTVRRGPAVLILKLVIMWPEEGWSVPGRQA